MSRCFGTFALLMSLILSAGELKAQLVDWTNSTSTDHHWANVNNWNTGQFPGPNDTARFDIGGNYDVDFDGIAQVDIAAIRVNSGWVEFVNSTGSQTLVTSSTSQSIRVEGTDSRLTLRSVSFTGEDIDLQDGGELYVTNSLLDPNPTNVQLTGNLVNNGHLILYQGANVRGQALFTAWGGFNPNGEVTVRGRDTTATFNGIRIGQNGIGEMTVDLGGSVHTEELVLGYSDGGVGTVLIDGASSTVNAELVNIGNGGDGHLTIQNQGRLISNYVRVGGFESDTFGSTLVSGGTLETNYLEVGRAFFGVFPLGPAQMTIDQGGEVIVAEASNISGDATVSLNHGRFHFGTMEDFSFERISATNGELYGNVNFYGTSNFSNLTRNISNDVDTSQLTFTNLGGSIYGGGDFGHGIQNRGDIQVGPGERLVLRGNTVVNQGRFTNHGGIVHFTSQFINQEFETNGPALLGGRGTFIASSWQNTSAMAFSAGSTDILGDFENLAGGIIVTSGGGVTTFFDDVIHNGEEIRTSAGSQTVFFGAVSGAGAFKGDGTVYFEGDLRPGNSPDTVSFDGNVVLGSGNRTVIELAGINEGEFDKLLIKGDFRIDGELLVDIIDGHTVGSNEFYLIAEVDGEVSGQFNGLDEGAFVGNFHGHDLFISYQAGDGNDLALFSSVPEPGSAWLLIATSFGLVLRRRRRTKG